MRILPGGRIRLRANEFEVRQGYVRFDDSDPHRAERRRHRGHRIPPLLGERRGHAVQRERALPAAGSRTGGVWRITLHAYGDADNLRLDMTSEPPSRKKTSCCS